jgi:hypothetical protein
VAKLFNPDTSEMAEINAAANAPVGAIIRTNLWGPSNAGDEFADLKFSSLAVVGIIRYFKHCRSFVTLVGCEDYPGSGGDRRLLRPNHSGMGGAAVLLRCLPLAVHLIRENVFLFFL